MRWLALSLTHIVIVSVLSTSLTAGLPLNSLLSDKNSPNKKDDTIIKNLK